MSDERLKQDIAELDRALDLCVRRSERTQERLDIALAALRTVAAAMDYWTDDADETHLHRLPGVVAEAIRKATGEE